MVLPLLAALVFVLINFGKALYYYIDLTHVANEGARIATVEPRHRVPGGGNLAKLPLQPARRQRLRASYAGTSAVDKANVVVSYNNGGVERTSVIRSTVSVSTKYHWIPFFGGGIDQRSPARPRCGSRTRSPTRGSTDHHGRNLRVKAAARRLRDEDGGIIVVAAILMAFPHPARRRRDPGRRLVPGSPSPAGAGRRGALAGAQMFNECFADESAAGQTEGKDRHREWAKRYAGFASSVGAAENTSFGQGSNELRVPEQDVSGIRSRESRRHEHRQRVRARQPGARREAFAGHDRRPLLVLAPRDRTRPRTRRAQAGAVGQALAPDRDSELRHEQRRRDLRERVE